MLKDLQFNLTEQPLVVPQSQMVVRLSRSYWHDQKGLHSRLDLNVLRRKSRGCLFALEDCDYCGAEDVIPRITNLTLCSDGIYTIEPCDQQYDWESGALDDYNYKLVPFEESL